MKSFLTSKHRVAASVLGIAILVMAIRSARGEEPVKPAKPVRKLAFLVGVSKYEKAGLGNLSYAEDDVAALDKALTAAGFSVQTLLGSGTSEKQASRDNLRSQLEGKFADSLEKLSKRDVVLIGLSGHGQQLTVERNGRTIEDQFFCPVDALKTNPATLLSISDLIELVGRKSGAENNLFVIDACRDNPAKGGKGIDGSRISLPVNMAALFGASSGKRSFESDELKHGLLSYYLLEGLKGEAPGKDGEVNWDSLVGYTKKQVSDNAPRLVNSEQTPNSVSNINGAPPVLVGGRSTSAGKVRDDNALKMKLAYCPSGKFMMGSPEGEEGRQANEKQAAVTLSRAFWIGQTSVTQSQFKTVMKDQPTAKSEPWRDDKSIKLGDNFPATHVDWQLANEFCHKLTELEKTAGRLPAGWEYDLPTEAQHEYAGRADAATAFSFGENAKQLGDHAWFQSNASQAGQEYPHEVATRKPNHWELYDMHGNINEWCADLFQASLPGGTNPRVDSKTAIDEIRVNRGGTFKSSSDRCRSAARNANAPSYRDATVGFRVVVNPAD